MANTVPFKSSGVLPLARLTELTIPPVRRPTGRLPWKLVPNHMHAAVLDHDGNTLFISSIGIAKQILAAVNSHTALYSKNAELELGLRCLHGGLHELDRTPRVKKLIRMAQYALGIAGGGGDD